MICDYNPYPQAQEDFKPMTNQQLMQTKVMQSASVGSTGTLPPT